MRYVRTRGIDEIARSAKPPTFTLSFVAHTCHAWLARLTRARGRRFLRGRKALLNDFWYFSSVKSTIKEKLLYDSSLSEFFSLVRKERKGQKEERIPLLISFCRLAATGANKVPRPSRCSLATATGSKRLSADSDLLLCHVRLWRTSRFRFGCASVCEHSEIRVILIVSSAHSLHPRCPVSATPTHMLRICVNPPTATPFEKGLT